ncbi:MAG: M14 family metallopeptidase [Gammaproteobacteria bacterium]|nr:M14 family metallopeptidase [Gammaproteobacteria bacterium]
MSSAADIEHLSLPSPGPGTSRSLRVCRYGDPGSRPKVYLQAALHADEIPGLLVLHHLRRLLDEAQRRGEVRGHVVLNPFANPVGLSQNVHGTLLGRHALTGAGNFNRLYPDVTDAVAARIGERLGADGEKNISVIRAAIGEALDELSPLDDTDRLRLTLLRLACDADIVLDLHCDEEALLHLYTGTALWPAATDLSAQLGSRATLLAAESGGDPFDEAVASIWWKLAARFPDVPVPPACLSATVELRGQSDVNDELAMSDAGNLLDFLKRRGVVEGDPGPLPAPLCDATPLEGVDIIRAPVQGVVSHYRALGDSVEADDVVAVLVDPAAETPSEGRTEVRSRVSGLLFTRRAARFARAGDVLCKVAGSSPLPDRVGGHLLSD